MIKVRGLTVAQWPNRTLWTAILATAAAVATDGQVSRAANGVAGAAMIVWGYQEMFHGVNWFRRGLGAGGVAVAVLGLRAQLAERSAPAAIDDLRSAPPTMPAGAPAGSSAPAA